ncbi:MAG: glycosyltransferase [Nitrosospira sp.]|nr:glycosyltransferase [Nitrosospira sp.]
MPPFVVYWNNIPSPYMVERFNALADHGDFEFEAWFNDRILSDRSWDVDEKKWRFQYRYIPSTRICGRKYHWPLPVLGRRPDLLVSLYAEPSFIVGWAIAKTLGVKTAFRVLKTFDTWVNRSRLKSLARRIMFSHVDAIETPGCDGKSFAVASGARPEKVHLATHTVDVEYFRDESDRFMANRLELRSQLGLNGTTFIYVGRFWRGKGIEYLLDAFKQVKDGSVTEVSLLLIGDGEDENRLKRRCMEREIQNVIFAGFKQKKDLPKYYAVSDVFVFPTLGDPYGLVVDEAMACSLPVISSSAAGEITGRVAEGVNGYLVPPGDSRSLAKGMLKLSHDANLREIMGARSYEKVKNHTPDQWARDFEKLVKWVLGSSN